MRFPPRSGRGSPISPRVRPAPTLGSLKLPHVIQVGEQIDVAAPESVDGAYNFTLVAPTDGTLVLELAWNAPDRVLHMQVGETLIGVPVWYGDEKLEALPSYSTVNGKQSLVGSVRVSGGDVYRVWVASVPGPWDYGHWIDAPFTLTTRLQ